MEGHGLTPGIPKSERDTVHSAWSELLPMQKNPEALLHFVLVYLF